MPVFYVDTSALMKRYRTEAGTAVVDELLGDLRAGDRFYASFLTVLEVTSGLHRLVGAGQLDRAIADELLAHLRRDLRDYFHLWPLNNSVIVAAVSAVEQYQLRSADAIHLASALAIASRVQMSPIVMTSSDQDLNRAAASAGLIVLDPSDAAAATQLRGLR